MQETKFKECQSLRKIIGGGETWPATLINALHKTFSNCNLVNVYGPTETTIHVTYSQSDRNSLSQTLPIGRPIQNTQIYILDNFMNILPIGVPGQIYVGGVCLAEGYLNQKELTEEKFKKWDIPFTTKNSIFPAIRLYATGDIGKYLKSGVIEFLGRVDRQVKIRGYRIEISEIETALSQHPRVLSAYVVVKEDHEHNELLAFVVPAEEVKSQPDQIKFIQELRGWLNRKLPRYMEPSHFITVQHLPVTINGKVDEAELVKYIKPFKHKGNKKYIETNGCQHYKQNNIQASYQDSLKKIWREVLNTQEINLEDNFFDLGGHSLALIEVHSKIKNLLGLEISITDLFEYPTLGELIRKVDTILLPSAEDINIAHVVEERKKIFRTRHKMNR